MKFKQLIQDSHELAKKKGWWDYDEEFPREAIIEEKLLMIHCEISEAVECYRNGEMVLSGPPPGKPEGFVVELADVAIRAADLLGYLYSEGDDSSGEVETWIPTKLESVKAQPLKSVDFAEAMLELHSSVSSDTLILESLIYRCHQLIARHGYDFDAVVRQKHEYNKTRSYRHGGKKI